MKLGTLFTINSIVVGLFAIGFVLAPGPLLAPYGLVDLSAGAILVARLFGAALCGFCIISVLVRGAPDSVALRAIVTAFFLADGIGFVVALLGQLAGVTNALGWSTVAIYLLLGAGFGYFQMKPPAGALMA